MSTREEPIPDSEDTSQSVASSRPSMMITPAKGWDMISFRDLWEYRELVYFLTLRDIKVRYKQTVLGVAWAVLQPLGMMAVFTIFFGKLAGIPSEGVPYPVFVYSALLPWQLFSRAIGEAANSLVGGQQLITRVYFPRTIIPLSTVLAGLVEFGVSIVILIGLMLYYGILPTAAIWTLPLFFLLMLMTALAVGLWLSALNVEYRDVRYVLPFLSQMWLFITPVIYSSSLLPEKWLIIYGLNPMAGVVEGFRWALLGVGPGPSPLLAVSTGVAVFLFFTGLMFFRNREKTFADVLGSGGR